MCPIPRGQADKGKHVSDCLVWRRAGRGIASEPGAKLIGGEKEIKAPTNTLPSLLITHLINKLISL